MKVIIIEDEAPAFRRFQKILEEVDPTIEIVEVLDSVESSVEWMKTNTLPDLIFMDIQLSDGISFEIFDQVEVTKPVIFTTAYNEYMLKAFRVNSIDYLLKPIKPKELKGALDKLKSLQKALGSAMPSLNLNEVIQSIKLTEKKYKSRFLIKQGDNLLVIRTNEIAYFYTKHGVVHLVTKTGKTHLTDFTLDDLEQQLDPLDFFRANRQVFLSLSAIKMVHRYHKGKLLVEVEPDYSETLIVSSEKSSSFKSWLGDEVSSEE